MALFIAGLGPTEQEIRQERQIKAKLESLEAQRRTRYGQFENS